MGTLKKKDKLDCGGVVLEEKWWILFKCFFLVKLGIYNYKIKKSKFIPEPPPTFIPKEKNKPPIKKTSEIAPQPTWTTYLCQGTHHEQFLVAYWLAAQCVCNVLACLLEWEQLGRILPWLPSAYRLLAARPLSFWGWNPYRGEGIGAPVIGIAPGRRQTLLKGRNRLSTFGVYFEILEDITQYFNWKSILK